MSNKLETLGGYIRKILDVNKDGVITYKDFLALFPNNAIAIAVVFVDLAVLVAEYRVWDVGIQITHNPLKAWGFVLVSALPFYLGELFWLYPQATFWQKTISVLMVGGGLYTSARFGLADLSQSYNVAAIVVLVIQLTVAYIVVVLLYILFDPNIKAWRAMVVARGALDLEMKYQNMTRQLLTEWQKTQTMERETINLFGGDEEAVVAQLNALRGKKPKSNSASVESPGDSPKSTGNNVPENDTGTQYTLPAFLEASGMKTEQAFGGFLDETEKLSMAWKVLRDGKSAKGYKLPPNITHSNFDNLATKMRANGKVANP